MAKTKKRANSTSSSQIESQKSKESDKRAKKHNEEEIVKSPVSQSRNEEILKSPMNIIPEIADISPASTRNSSSRSSTSSRSEEVVKSPVPSRSGVVAAEARSPSSRNEEVVFAPRTPARKNRSASSRCELIFPVSRIRRYLRAGNYANHIQTGKSTIN